MTTFAIEGPLERADLPGLYERACAVLTEMPDSLLVCEIQNVDADAVTVNALARLRLAALRHTCQVEFRGASAELRELIRFMGLDDVLSA